MSYLSGKKVSQKKGPPKILVYWGDNKFQNWVEKKVPTFPSENFLNLGGPFFVFYQSFDFPETP